MGEPVAGYFSHVVLRKGALLALALVAGCDSSRAGDKPDPVTRHLGLAARYRREPHHWPGMYSLPLTATPFGRNEL